MSKDWRTDAESAAEIWRASESCLVLTGAGISVPSGIPDFRSPGGLWERFRPEEVATLQALRAHPDKVWKFLLEAHTIFSGAKPNPAHKALARLEQAGKVQAVVTQNIDNLHQRAGSRNVIEFHGSGQRYYCMGCKRDYDPQQVSSLTTADIPWHCEDCGKIIRPDFVFFNEQIPAKAMNSALAAAQQADLVVIIGTSGEVAPANTLPLYPKRKGGKVLEFNMDTSMFGDVSDIVVTGPAEESLPFVCDLLLG